MMKNITNNILPILLVISLGLSFSPSHSGCKWISYQYNLGKPQMAILLELFQRQGNPPSWY